MGHAFAGTAALESFKWGVDDEMGELLVGDSELAAVLLALNWQSHPLGWLVLVFGSRLVLLALGAEDASTDWAFCQGVLSALGQPHGLYKSNADMEVYFTHHQQLSHCRSAASGPQAKEASCTPRTPCTQGSGRPSRSTNSTCCHGHQHCCHWLHPGAAAVQGAHSCSTQAWQQNWQASWSSSSSRKACCSCSSCCPSCTC